MKYRLRFLAAAEQDIKDGFDYLLPLAGEATATRYVEQLLDACEGLCDFPFRGAPRDEIRAGLRIHSVKRSATIAYAVFSNEVAILRILRRGRDLDEAFGVEDWSKA